MLFNSASVPLLQAYRCSAKAKGEAELILYGDIGDSWFGGVSAKQVSDDLRALGNVETINVRINSAGGDVFDGLTIYRRLVDHPARIVVHVDGLAASIASVIAMAGNEINISESGLMMIHNAWGIAIGSADDMRTMAGLLDTTTASIRDVYVARTSQSADQVKAWMDAETWFTADECVTNGFATKATDNLRLAAKFDGSKHRFRNAPASLAARPNAERVRATLIGMRTKLARAKAS